MNEYFNKTHPFKKRGFGIGLSAEPFIPFLKVLRIIIIIAVISPIIIGKAKFEYKQYLYRQNVADADKLNRARYKQEMDKKAREERQYQEWLKERQKEQDEKKIQEYKENIQAQWKSIKNLYPEGTYIENLTTHKRGRVVDYQGDRIFMEVKNKKEEKVIDSWWFDLGEPIEVTGYKEYAKYRQYLEKIK